MSMTVYPNQILHRSDDQADDFNMKLMNMNSINHEEQNVTLAFNIKGQGHSISAYLVWDFLFLRTLIKLKLLQETGIFERHVVKWKYM